MTQNTSLNIEEILAARQAKLDKLRTAKQAYPNNFNRSHKLAETKDLPHDDAIINLAGRLTNLRTAGKACFANIADESGDIQIYCKQDNAEVFAWLNDVDFGDVVGVSGSLFNTKKGELTLRLATGITLAKCLQNYTPKDALTKERERKRRYLALAQNKELRQRFMQRSNIIAEIRKIFTAHNFIEVETPMLHSVQGGAAARPFITLHHSLKTNYFLRIAPELYLKRLLVGGYDQVFEINRSFRNEGMSDAHNPEFTMLEFYATYRTYKDFMMLTTGLFRKLTAINWREDENFKENILTWNNHEINFANDFKVISMEDSLCEYNNWSKEQIADKDFLLDQLNNFEGEKVANANTVDIGVLQFILFEKTVEDKLIQPTFVIDYPASVSPLARRSNDDPTKAERFEFFVGGCEIANGFSELNDPDEQAKVFREQVAKAQEGDAEAMQYDEDYITALRYGMPPACGEGIGIDRLVMMLLDCESIKDVILFPQQKPEKKAKD